MTEMIEKTILPKYPFSEGASVKLLQKGYNNEIYVITDDNVDFYLRVSPKQFRKLEETAAEVELLLHLMRNDVKVAAPIPMTDGTYISELSDSRCAVLFADAGGKVLTAKNGIGDESARCGSCKNSCMYGEFKPVRKAP